MKTFSSILALCVPVFMAAAAVAAPGPDQQSASGTGESQSSIAVQWTTNPVLVRLNAFYEKTTDFSASFSQTVNTKAPRRTFKRAGNVYFKRPGLMRWDYTTPEAVYYVSDGTVLWAYDAEDRSAAKMKVTDSDLYSSLGFLSGTSRLSDSFIPDVKASKNQGYSSVTLVPIEGAGNYKYVTLEVDNGTGEVVETEIIDPMGNKSTIRFESPKYAPVPAKAFEFKVPAGVTVQDLTRGNAAGVKPAGK